MHKRNVALMSLLLAGLISLAFYALPSLKASPLGWVYLPGVAVAVLLSGQTHSPSAIALNSGFVTFSITYMLFVVIGYVVILEFYLLRKALTHLDKLPDALRQQHGGTGLYLERLGVAFKDLETRRRTHFLLNPHRELDLGREPQDLAAQAIAQAPEWRATQRLLDRVHRHISTELGEAHAVEHMRSLREYSAKRYADSRRSPT